MGKLNKEHGTYPGHSRVNDELKSYNWCFNNKILIGPVPLWKENWGKWTVEIQMNGKRNIDPSKYERESIMHKVYEYCDYYYNKYKKDGE